MSIDQAIKRIQHLAANSAPYGSRVTAEQEYAQAYDALVREGKRPKLRAKYRVR